MDIHIHTQYRENYGTPDEPYWKYKGGSTVVVTGFSHPLNDSIGRAAQSVVDSLRSTIEYSNPMAEESVIDWEFMESGALTRDEQNQMEYDGRVYAPAQRIEVGA